MHAWPPSLPCMQARGGRRQVESPCLQCSSVVCVFVAGVQRGSRAGRRGVLSLVAGGLSGEVVNGCCVERDVAHVHHRVGLLAHHPRRVQHLANRAIHSTNRGGHEHAAAQHTHHSGVSKRAGLSDGCNQEPQRVETTRGRRTAYAWDPRAARTRRAGKRVCWTVEDEGCVMRKGEQCIGEKEHQKTPQLKKFEPELKSCNVAIWSWHPQSPCPQFRASLHTMSIHRPRCES
jgi:hypothetical protein